MDTGINSLGTFSSGGALIHLIVRRRGMGERQSAALSAQALLDAGAIADEEFRAFKTQALV